MSTEGSSPRAGAPERPTLPSAEFLRRRLRLALVRARQEAGLTQKATSELLDWSVSKVVRIEQGAVPVAPSDVRVLLAVLGVTDEARVGELVQLARDAREAMGFSEYEDILSAPFRELIGQEGSASVIWMYEPLVVPGYFQTASYSRHLLEALGHVGDAAERRARLRERRQLILDVEPGPEIHVIIGEAALIRPAGGADTMREQLRHLVELGLHPRIHISMLPLSAGVHQGMGEPFTLLQFNDEQLDDSLYLEDAEKRTTSRDDPASLEKYLRLYNLLEEMATQSGPFDQLVNRIIKERYSQAA